MARPPGEPPARPVGIVDQPCATPIAPTPPANETDKTAKDWRERILDPSEGRDFEPPEPSATSAMHAAEEERLRNDTAAAYRAPSPQRS